MALLAPDRPAVVVLADDLIWATRLADAARAAGAEVRAARHLAALEAALASAPALSEARPAFAIVDLTARGYEPLAAIHAAVAAGARVLAVGQHDDHDLRRAAFAAGAERVLAYRKLHEDGSATIRAWLAAAPRQPRSPRPAIRAAGVPTP